MKTYAAKIWRYLAIGTWMRAIDINNCAIKPDRPLNGFTNVSTKFINVSLKRSISICRAHLKIQYNWHKKSRKTMKIFLPAVVPGFEPGQTEPKPVVLPLHHTTIALCPERRAKVLKKTLAQKITGRFLEPDNYSAMSR